MTAKQLFEGMLTEVSKTGAPSMLLQDFNYLINKAINQYVNKRYNIYDINQQTTDDLRVLKSTSTLGVTEAINPLESLLTGKNLKLFGATYEVILPDDYLHILNCVCVYRLSKNFKCYDANEYVAFPAKRLTADSFSTIMNDYYNRPLPERPYFYIHNVNDNYIAGELRSDLTPTNSATDITKPYGVTVKTDQDGNTIGTEHTEDGESNFPRKISLGNLWKGTSKEQDVVERVAGQRYGNASKVRMEIRYGHDNSVFILERVLVDYIKAPQYIRLTQEQMNLTEDTSQILEFPDYVCQEILNELTMLVLANNADPRLQTNTIVTQSIANPAQQQTPQTQPPQQRRG